MNKTDSDKKMDPEDSIWFYTELIDFYNINGLKSVFVTFDVDWAPEYTLRRTVNWLKENEIIATFFATHSSPILKSLKDTNIFELSIHPDFSKGADPILKIQDLLLEYPNALGSRNHRNLSGRNYSDALRQKGVLYDVSKILWSQPYCQCVPMYNGMIESAYSWEDGTHLELGIELDLKHVPVHKPGLLILAFHPVLFDLNCRSYEELKLFTSRYKPLTSAPEKEFNLAINHGFGMGAFSRQLLLYLKAKGVKFQVLKEVMKPAFEIECRRPRFPLKARGDHEYRV
jgi:hypothetical protein